MYDACIFYAERVNGHKGSALAGTVLVIAKNPRRNGECVEAASSPKGQPSVVPCTTWVHPSHLAKRCTPITEAQARQIQPSMFAALERFDRAPEFRTMHAVLVARAYASGTYTMQPASEAVLSILCPSTPEEVDDERGFAHR